MREIYLLKITGHDAKGVTAGLSRILAKYEVNILDIGQAVIHDALSLGMLIEVPPEVDSSPILKDVLFQTYQLGVEIKFEPISIEDYKQWVDSQGKSRYIITLLARKVTAQHISDVSQIIKDNNLNIDSISRLSGRVELESDDRADTKSCVQLTLRGQPNDIDAMRREFLEISHRSGLDIAFQKDDAYRRNRRLVVFDMDSTLIEAEVIDELAYEAGVGDQVAAITEMAMEGKVDFDESFSRRLALLKGLDQSALLKVAENLKITEGAASLIKTLHTLGYKTAILSGGFTYFGEYLQKKLGIDYIYANELEIIDGKVTGNVIGKIVNGARKAELLKEIANKERIRLEQVIAVGDGANDLPMLQQAGLGIAFRAKPIVKESAKHAISTLGLDGILYLIGVRDREQIALLEMDQS